MHIHFFTKAIFNDSQRLIHRFAILVSFSLISCANVNTLKPGEGGEYYEVRGKSYDQVWRAAVLAVNQKLTIVSQDKPKGIIKAKQPVDLANMGTFVGVFITPTSNNAKVFTIELQNQGVGDFLYGMDLYSQKTNFIPQIAASMSVELDVEVKRIQPPTLPSTLTAGQTDRSDSRINSGVANNATGNTQTLPSPAKPVIESNAAANHSIDNMKNLAQPSDRKGMPEGGGLILEAFSTSERSRLQQKNVVEVYEASAKSVPYPIYAYMAHSKKNYEATSITIKLGKKIYVLFRIMPDGPNGQNNFSLGKLQASITNNFTGSQILVVSKGSDRFSMSVLTEDTSIRD